MRLVGCSTGAIARGDFSSALDILRSQGIDVVEVSLLREEELMPFVRFLEGDCGIMEDFSVVSIHAPKSFSNITEEQAVELLKPVFARNWPVVVHADSIVRPDCWSGLGNLVCIENMDSRKKIGRTARELEKVFRRLPEASFCFDIGHARQVDRTMTHAEEMIQAFGDRIRMLHVSEVSLTGEHQLLSRMAMMSYRHIAAMLPEDAPAVIESPVASETIAHEVRRVRESLQCRRSGALAG